MAKTSYLPFALSNVKPLFNSTNKCSYYKRSVITLISELLYVLEMPLRGAKKPAIPLLYCMKSIRVSYFNILTIMLCKFENEFSHYMYKLI